MHGLATGRQQREGGASLPMRGMCEAAGGVESARRRRRTKNATKMFIPREDGTHTVRVRENWGG